MFWRIVSLITVAGATATLFTSRRRSPAQPHPEALNRWEDEGGNVPSANLSHPSADPEQ